MAGTICIYHHNCADGFTAAWVVNRAAELGLVALDEFYGGIHQATPPDVTGKHVLFVDFSYKGDDLQRVLDQAESVTILDHHQTAQEEIQPLLDQGAVDGVFDMERSGARIAWDWFFPNLEPPMPLKVVEDRDLWRFRFNETRAAMAAIFSYDYTMENWDILMYETPMPQLVAEGEAINRKHDKDIREFIEAAKQTMEIAGFDVPVLNAPYFWSSDAGHIMGQGRPFAACYWDTPEGRTFSLRSDEHGVDVAEIAKQYGGGGHKHAAGFRVKHDHPLACQG